MHIFSPLVESVGVIKKMKEILQKKRWYSLCYYISITEICSPTTGDELHTFDNQGIT